MNYKAMHSPFHLSSAGGVDFNSSSPGDLFFSPGSAQGALQCITITLLSDIFFEVPENFVIELFSTDPAVTIPESADIAIITITDVPDPQGRMILSVANRI
jgi:hypothetical protein